MQVLLKVSRCPISSFHFPLSPRHHLPVLRFRLSPGASGLVPCSFLFVPPSSCLEPLAPFPVQFSGIVPNSNRGRQGFPSLNWKVSPCSLRKIISRDSIFYSDFDERARKAKKAKTAMGMIQLRRTTPMKPHKSSRLGKRAWPVSNWRKDRKAQSRTTTRDQPRISHFIKEAIGSPDHGGDPAGRSYIVLPCVLGLSPFLFFPGDPFPPISIFSFLAPRASILSP